MILGLENLAAFFAAQVRAKDTGVPIKIHLVGDSKVVGNGATPGYRIDQLLPLASNGFPVQITHEGFGGQNSYLWKTTEAADFVAQRPNIDLLIVNFGTNERVVSAVGGPQSAAQTKQNHVDAVNAIRLSRPASQLSILLLGQPPANNWQSDYNQTTAVMEEVNAALLEAASELNCAFFDTLSLFHRAHAEAGWMEQLPSPEYGGGNVHTGDPFNLAFVGELGRALFPFRFISADAGGVVTPALLNGWTPWANLPEYAPRIQFSGGEVRLSGVVKPGALAANTILFNLPVGSRPITNRFFSVSTGNAGTVAEVQVLAYGAVRIAATFTGTYVALDQISFRVD